MMLKAFAVALVALPLTGTLAVPASTYPHMPVDAAADDRALAPLHASGSNHIADSYIVVLKSTLSSSALSAHLSFVNTFASTLTPSRNTTHHGFTAGVQNVYMTTVKGYSGMFDQETLGKIREADEVEYVERDQTVWASKVQNGAPWGLARVSHRGKLGFGNFRTYQYDAEGGEGVDVYVIDTGINVNHVSFEGRAKWGHTMPKNDVDEDGNGHGTHCAGTIASKDYGVAKKAHVIAVKVLGSNGSGSMSDVIGGVDWAATAALDKAKQVRAEEARTGKQSNFKGSVANLSLGGGKSPTLDRTINASVDSGLHIAVAAGNDNKDACNYSPAAAEKAVTVGASTVKDERAYFSNFGKCVDVFGPGLNILSTWNTGRYSTNTISGTSMASPHVAGLLAYLLSLYPSKTFAPNTEELFLAPQPPSLLDAFSGTSNPTLLALKRLASFILPSYFFSLPPATTSSADILNALVAPIPVPAPVISPAALKKALILLSTKGALSDVGEGSPNLLVFNNFTSQALREEGFWKQVELEM